MKTQTIDDMINAGATIDEARIATAVYAVLRPCLKIDKNGMVGTAWGTKTPLGLYRAINRVRDEIIYSGGKKNE